MSGNAKINERRTAILMLGMRTVLAGLLLVHAIAQLTAFWRAAQIVSPGAFANPVLLFSAAVPIVIFIGAGMLMIGFKTRFTALALMLLLAVASVMDLLLFGAVGSALDWLPRFSVMGGLLVVFVTGAGRLSIDGWTESRLAPRTAQ
jgi:putative oxidoreductase